MARKTLSEYWAFHRDGDFTLVNNVWNPGGLQNGVDYTQSVTFGRRDITTDVLFRWDWPAVGHVVAYPEIVAGFKPWGQEGSDTFATRLDRLRKLEVTVDYDISGDTADFNVAFDIWLSARKLAGSAHVTTELMIWTHSGGALQPAGDMIGNYRKGDFRAEIWVAENFGDSSGSSNATWRYIALRSTQEIRADTIDIDAIIRNLVKRDLIDERDFLNGYEFGAEVTGGTGEMDLHEISHEFGRRAAAQAGELNAFPADDTGLI